VSTPAPAPRSTIRWRLTILFGLLFLLCGALVLATSYLMVSASLSRDEGKSIERVVKAYGYTPEGVEAFYNWPVPPPAPETGRQASTVGDVIVDIQGDITDDALRQLLIGSGVALLAMGGLSIFFGWIAAGRALRPVGDLTARAQE